MTTFKAAMEGIGWASWWRLNESSGTTAHDTSGKNTGTYFGPPTLGVPARVFGEDEIAIALAGEQGVEIPPAASLNLSNTFTLLCRCELTKAGEGTFRSLISKLSGAYELRLADEGGALELVKAGVATIAHSAGGTSADGKVHLFVATMNGSSATAKIYIDGIDVTSLATEETLVDNSEELLLGWSGGEPGNYAVFGDAAVAGFAITAAQVEALWEASNGPPPDLLFDGSTIAIFEEEGLVQEQEPGRILERADPAGSGETVFQFEVKNHDLETEGGEVQARAQMSSPEIIKPGHEYWIATAFWIPSQFTLDGLTESQFYEGPYGRPFGGPPPLGLAIRIGQSGDEVFRWQRNKTYAFDIPWAIRCPKGSWIYMLQHFKFASKAEGGFMELWINGEQVTFDFAEHNPNAESPAMKLLMDVRDESNNEGASKGIIQQYRSNTESGSEWRTNYNKRLRIGSTREAVELEEYEPAPQPPRRSNVQIPKLRVPFEASGGGCAVVEQDSAQEVSQCVYAVLATPRGSRLEVPDYGIVDPTFDTLPLNLAEALGAIRQWEPRAEVSTTEEIEGMTERVSVGVQGGL